MPVAQPFAKIITVTMSELIIVRN